MNEDIRIMMELYNTYEVDWMVDSFTNPSKLTRHHIVKRENGGVNDISNYALLTKESHMLLHYLEDNYNKEYNYLNEKFLELNRSLMPPTIEYYQDVKKILKSVKKRIKNNKSLKRKR